MADVKIENNPPVVEREVIREPVPVVDNSGNNAGLIIVALILVALLIGAFFVTQTRSRPADTVTTAAEQVGDAAGDAAGTVKKTLTVE
ncbi:MULTISPECIES: hypothetical protein [Asticcacaulis]|uniref:hypothetical protein n=1 Tax=Asticcacaulis TaxID=76890 RepID=UPI001AE5D7F1|nr:MULTISPECIES: hypothetical protein [Asticcacaulis]MBP2158763.1 hypothetical protein [Asticcacaulis solisilvae]MDR6799809.1 hypothetical protein [Asticcacaulis sp. BE141]